MEFSGVTPSPTGARGTGGGATRSRASTRWLRGWSEATQMVGTTLLCRARGGRRHTKTSARRTSSLASVPPPPLLPRRRRIFTWGATRIGGGATRIGGSEDWGRAPPRQLFHPLPVMATSTLHVKPWIFKRKPESLYLHDSPWISVYRVQNVSQIAKHSHTSHHISIST
jgi:hypothetical protein